MSFSIQGPAQDFYQPVAAQQTPKKRVVCSRNRSHWMGIVRVHPRNTKAYLCNKCYLDYIQPIRKSYDQDPSSDVSDEVSTSHISPDQVEALRLSRSNFSSPPRKRKFSSPPPQKPSVVCSLNDSHWMGIVRVSPKNPPNLICEECYQAEILPIRKSHGDDPSHRKKIIHHAKTTQRDLELKSIPDVPDEVSTSYISQDEVEALELARLPLSRNNPYPELEKDSTDSLPTRKRKRGLESDNISNTDPEHTFVDSPPSKKPTCPASPSFNPFDDDFNDDLPGFDPDIDLSWL